MDNQPSELPSEDMAIDELNQAPDGDDQQEIVEDTDEDLFSEDDEKETSKVSDEAEVDAPEKGENTEESQPDNPTEGMSEKERNAYFAQRRIAERRAKLMQSEDNYVSELNDRLQGALSESELPEDADELEAQVYQQNQLLNQLYGERMIEKVQNTRESLSLGIVQAETDIPLFNEGSEEFNQSLYDDAMGVYADMYLETAEDSAGEPQVVGVKPGAPPIYQFLKSRSEMYQGIIKDARARGQANATRSGMATSIPSASPSSGDSVKSEFDGWDDTDY